MMQNIRLSIALNALNLASGMYAAGDFKPMSLAKKAPSALTATHEVEAPAGSMIAYIPYYGADGSAYMLVTMHEGKADINAMRKPKPQGDIAKDDYFLNWISDHSTVAKLDPQDSSKSFTLNDGTTVYFVRVSKVDAKGEGKWMSANELYGSDANLSPDAKEVVHSKHWNDIVKSYSNSTAANGKGKKNKRNKKK